VGRSDSYVVRISGLGEGEHGFSFDLGQKFFASFDESEIEHGKVNARVILEKRQGIMVLHFHLKGDVEVTCDRCLDLFMTKVQCDQQLIVKRGDIPGEAEDDVIVIGKEDHEIDIRQYLYEFVILALPCKRIHSPDKHGLSTCNPAMIEILEAHQENRNNRREGTDPRWNALKEITGNNK